MQQWGDWKHGGKTENTGNWDTRVFFLTVNQSPQVVERILPTRRRSIIIQPWFAVEAVSEPNAMELKQALSEKPQKTAFPKLLEKNGLSKAYKKKTAFLKL